MINPWHGLGLRYKLVLPVVLLMALLLAALAVLIAYQVGRDEAEDTRALAEQTANHYAHFIKSELEADLEKAHTLAHIFETSANSDGLSLSRTQVNILLKYFIEQNTHLFGVSAAFEANAFDGRDANFIDEWGHDHTGRLVTYWTRDEQGHGVLEALTDYESADYYQIPRRTNRPSLIEPYFYTVRGKDVLMTSVIAVIQDRLGQFIGIVGIDRDFSALQRMLEKNKVGNFDQAYLTFFSAKGTVVAGSNSHYFGKAVREITSDSGYIDGVLSNRPFLIESRHSRTLQGNVMTVGVPVDIGDTGSRWMVAINIPETAAVEGRNRLLLWVAGVTLTMLVIGIVATYFFARRLTRPLLQVSSQLSRLARGELSAQEFSYRGTDEIGTIIQSSQRLQDAIENTIAQANAVAAGNYDSEIAVQSDDDQLGRALADMTHTLREAMRQTAEQDWIKTGLAQLNDKISGDQEVVHLAARVITFLGKYLKAQIGLFYVLQERNDNADAAQLELLASYAFEKRKHLGNRFALGEGLVGQAGLERKFILATDVPANYIQVSSGLGHRAPKHLLAAPVLHEGQLKGVIELGTLQGFSDLELEFLKQVLPAIGVALNSAESRARMQVLLRRDEGREDGKSRDAV